MAWNKQRWIRVWYVGIAGAKCFSGQQLQQLKTTMRICRSWCWIQNNRRTVHWNPQKFQTAFPSPQKKKSLLDILTQQLQEKKILSLSSSINDKNNSPSFCQNYYKLSFDNAAQKCSLTGLSVAIIRPSLPPEKIHTIAMHSCTEQQK